MDRRTMTRSAARRSGPIQTEKSPPPAPPAPAQRPDDPLSPPETNPGATWYWRFVMFLWFTSLLGLFAYELLGGILKSWSSSGNGS
jgi:hypothetical protein